VFIEAKDDGGGGDNWTTGAISRAKLQSNHHHQQTNILFFFTCRMPFLSPNQQRFSSQAPITTAGQDVLRVYGNANDDGATRRYI